MRIEPLRAGFGATIQGIDPAREADASLRAALQDAIDRHAVLVFPGQRLDTEGQLRFSRIFGELQPTLAARRDGAAAAGPREVGSIGNVDALGRTVGAGERQRILQLSNLLWHTDEAFSVDRGRYTFLSAHVVPPEGGATQFVDMRAAFSALPVREQNRLLLLRVRHSLAQSRRLAGTPALAALEEDRFPAVWHPLVHAAADGRLALYLASYACAIEGWNDDDARREIDRLMAAATRPELVLEHRWREGDLVMWDNFCTMHRGTPFDDQHHRRQLRRTTVSESGARARRTALTAAA
ncbi:TauD/TfdA dioxygenase family protein [Xenophilus azovorans]|uniref:TauD/TfdA dioxygenase family protein n=1 Tax=Xenophilus azovorans TaxID=151755 RepID=UPI00056F2FE4|nr:TauD/TfdA family dioxygenase [Xenophilus azovorans]